MACVKWNLPAFLVFLLLLQLLPMVLMEYEIHQACPGVSNSSISKKGHTIGILLDWVANNGTVTEESLNGSNYNVFLSSQAAQAALSQVIHINNSSQILQEHQLCLVIVLYRFNDLEEMQNFAVTLSRSKARAVMNAIRDENSFSKLNKILPHHFPTVLVSAHSHRECFSHEEFEGMHRTTFHAPYSTYVTLDISPTDEDLLAATYSFAKHMGWERIGVIDNCDKTRSASSLNSTIFFTQYNPTNLVEMFKPFAKNEIRVYVFVGNLTTYLKLIRVAYTMGVTQKG